MKQSSSSWAPRLRRLAVAAGTLLLALGGAVALLGAVAALRAVLGTVSNHDASSPVLAITLFASGVLTSSVGFVVLFLVVRSVEPEVEYVSVGLGVGHHSIETLSEYRTRLAEVLEVDRSRVTASRIGYGGSWFLRTNVPWPDDERLPAIERRVLDAVGSPGPS